jgi:hypothetical protein
MRSAKYPFGHSLHSDSPASALKRPMEQLTQSSREEESGTYLPGGQASHEVAPTTSRPLHFLQEAEPSRAAYVPIEHFAHRTSPDEYWPALHGTQSCQSLSLNSFKKKLPSGQRFSSRTHPSSRQKYPFFAHLS